MTTYQSIYQNFFHWGHAGANNIQGSMLRITCFSIEMHNVLVPYWFSSDILDFIDHYIYIGYAEYVFESFFISL